MKRLHALALALGFLAIGPTKPAEAQCSKRILIYLDVSGSMDPRGRDFSSPYRLSVEALGLLLREPGFIEASDVIEANIFGADPVLLADSRGSAGVEALLSKMASYSAPARETDVVKVLEASQTRLGGSTSFNRQVVVIASDFAHEPRDGLPVSEAESSWRTAFGGLEATIRARFAPDQKVSLVLLQAPILRSGREDFVRSTQGVVLASLRGAVPSSATMPIGSGGLDAAGIATAIKRSLLNALEIRQVSRAKGRRDRVLVTITNPNCSQATVEALTLTCFGGTTAAGQPVAVEVPADQRTLAATGSAGETRTIDVALPSGPCWEAESSRFEAAARTPEGLEGRGAGTTGTWLEAIAKSAVLETSLAVFPDVLWLDIDLRGVHVGAASFPIEVSAEGDGNKSRLARVTFLAPESLDPTTSRSYRLFLPVRGSSANSVQSGDTLSVEITGARKVDGQTKVTSYNLAHWGEGINWVISLGALSAILSTVLGGRRKEEGVPTINRVNAWFWVAGLAVLVLPLLVMGCRRWLLENASFLVANAIQVMPPVVGFAALLFLVIRRHLTDQLERDVATGKIKTEAEFRRRAKRGPAALWACLLVFLLTTAAGFLFRNQSYPDSDGRVEVLKVVQP